jgi:hypothetical protein
MSKANNVAPLVRWTTVTVGKLITVMSCTHITLSETKSVHYSHTYVLNNPWAFNFSQLHLSSILKKQEVLGRTNCLLSFTVILVFNMRSRKKTLVCMRNEVNKTTQFWRLQCCYYWQDWVIRYTVEMASDDMTYILSFMKIVSGIQVILRLLPWQFERLWCWYY